MASAPSTSTQNGAGPSTSTASIPCPDPDVVAILTMRKAMGSLLDNVGFTHAQEGPLNVITDVAVRFMEKLCKEVKLASEYCGRSQPAMDDLTLAFGTMKFDRIDFHSYLSQVSSINPIPPLPAFPVDIPQKSMRINGYKPSREEKKNRPPHIPRFLPGIRPSGEEKEEVHVPVPQPSTSSSSSVPLYDKPSASFEKSKAQYLTRFEGDVPGFFGAAAITYGMKKTDKDKNPPVLPIMKGGGGGRRTEDERKRMEQEERNKRELEKRSSDETNGIHHKFKKHKDKEKSSSRPPSIAKVIVKPHKDKTPFKIKKEEKSRTNTPIIKENAPLLHPETAFHPTTSSFKQERMERESPRPLLSLNLFDDPAEEADIPLPRTPGNYLEDDDDEPDGDPLFFDPDPFGRMSSFNSSATPVKSKPTMKEEEKKRKEEKRARKEEKRQKKAADEVRRIEKERADRAAAKEAELIVARNEAKERERQRIAAKELLRAEKERKEREKAEESMRQEAELKQLLEKKSEELRKKAAEMARKMTAESEAAKKEKEAREKKRREDKEKERLKQRLQAQTPTKTPEPLRRSETPRVETPKPRELEAIRAAEEEKEDSSTIPFVMEDETTTSVAAPTGPTSFPLNMSLDEPSKDDRTVTPIKIKKHEDGEKTKKKHKKDKKERDEQDSSSNRDEEEKRREKERKKAKKRERREKEEREKDRIEKRVDLSPPIQDKIDPNKSGLKLTIKLGGVSSHPLAPPSLSSTPIPPRAPSSASDHPASLFKLKIKTPIDPMMEATSSSSCASVMPTLSTPIAPIMVPSKPRPVTKAELKATPASMPSLFKEESVWKHKHKKHKHSKASGSDSSSSSDEEERREKERRRERKKEKERIERERKEKEERREKEKEREREKEREKERDKEREKERDKEKEKIERERLERLKQEKEKERIEKEKRDREREREKEREKEKQKKKQTAFDLALQASTEKKKRKKEEPVEVIWICPVCSIAYVDGAEMIGCDCCDSWFHWQCVGIHVVPEGDNPWFCERCTPKNGELPNYGKNKKKCTHWSGQYMDWNIKKPKKSRDYE